MADSPMNKQIALLHTVTMRCKESLNINNTAYVRINILATYGLSCRVLHIRFYHELKLYYMLNI